MASEDATRLVERLEVLEERAGVRVDALAAKLEPGHPAYLTVRGELHSLAGTTLNNDVQLVVAAYDASGRVVGTGLELFYASRFFAFEVFSVFLSVDVEELTRIRVYPKASK